MEFVSSDRPNSQDFPETYIFPPETRPGNINFPVAKNIPVIDLAGSDRPLMVHQILNACIEFGFFQVINHGVAKVLMAEAMSVFEEFHSMTAEEKAIECSKDPKRSCKFYSSSEEYSTEKTHYWRDCLRHPCHHLDEFLRFWPEKPTRYRDVIGKYTSEVKMLGSKILELICEGLKLTSGYFNGGLMENPALMVNHYPPCPDPSLTLGLAKHRDPSIITILLQSHVHGLQVFKDNQWAVVEPVSNAFLVNTGYLLQIISNEKLMAPEHRVVTNPKEARTTASLFIYPSDDTIVEPAKALFHNETQHCQHPLYRSFTFEDFFTAYMSNASTIHESASLTTSVVSSDHQ